MAEFRTAPYIQNPASDAITVTWFTDTNEPNLLTVQGIGTFESTPALAAELAYQTSEVENLVGGNRPGLPYKHSIRVTGLSPSSDYNYSVSLNGDANVPSFQATLGTAPSSTETVRFAVYADSETEPESSVNRQIWSNPGVERPSWIETDSNGQERYLLNQTDGYRENLAAIADFSPDLVLIAGDLVESGGEQRDWDEFWRHNAGGVGIQDSITGSYSDVGLASHIPILPALGNHENFGGPGVLGGYDQDILVEGLGTVSATNFSTDKYLTYFEVPSNGAVDDPTTLEDEGKHEGRYYRLDYGKVTFITLDSSDGEVHQSAQDSSFFILPEANAPDFNPGSLQYAWAEAQLAEAQALGQTIFVQFHHAPYSSGIHGLPIEFGDRQSSIPLQVYSPLFEQYGVTAVFSGHDEMYEHSVVNGIHYYDIGIGGDGLRSPTLPVSNNPYQTFIANDDSPEIWIDSDGDGEIDRLSEGGKHYGHLQVEVSFQANGDLDQATFTPTYILPQTNPLGEVIGFETQVYDDIQIITNPPPMTSSRFGSPVVVSDNALGVLFLAAPDLDGDGDLDILSANRSAGELVWFQNLGQGQFSEAFVVSDEVTGIIAADTADLDGDGDLDIFSGSLGDDKIAWYENLGGGNFGPQQLISTASDGPASVVTVDIDDDGDLDVLAASFFDGAIAWYENLGGNSFSESRNVITTDAAGARTVATADLDGDGDLDVLSASRSDNKVAWYENLGNGNFGSQSLISSTADGAFSVITADVDLDGDLDVLAASRDDDTIAWYENLGNGSFSSANLITTTADEAFSITSADVDGDGDADVIAASFGDDTVAWYENLGGTFGPAQVIADDVDGATAAIAADFNGDGGLDVLAAAFNGNQITLYQAKPAIGVLAQGLSKEAGAFTSQFVVESQGVSPIPTTVSFVLEGSATLGIDYILEGAETLTGNQGTFILPAGESSLSLTVLPLEDALLEANESIVLSLLPGDNYNIQPIQQEAELTLVEESLPVALGFSATTFAQGLNYPNGIAVLDEGALLVGVNDGSTTSYGSGNSELLLLVDGDGDGVAEQQETVATGLPATITHIQQAADLVFVSSQDGLGRTSGTTKISVFRQSGAMTGSDPLLLSLLGSLDFAFTDSVHRAVALTLREVGADEYEIFLGFGAEGNNQRSVNLITLSSSEFNLPTTDLEADSIYRISLSTAQITPEFSAISQVAAGLRNPADFVFSDSTGELLFIENGIDGIDGNPGEPLTVDELNRLVVEDIGGEIEDFGFALEGTAYRTGLIIDGNGNEVTDSLDYVNPVAVFQPLDGSESEGPASLALAPSGFSDEFSNSILVGFFGEFGKGGLNNAENPVIRYDLETGESSQFIRNEAANVGHPITLAASENSLFVADLSSVGSLFSTEGNNTGVIHQITQKNTILGTVASELLIGTDQDDFIEGLAGNDIFFGGRGDDDISGGSGIDHLRGQAGADRLDGGLGNDLADYVNSNAAVQVDLLSGVGTGGHATGDTLHNIESLRGSRFGDQLLGDSGNNVISGLAGDDFLFGRDGADYLRGEAGADRLDGGASKDFVDYLNSPAAVSASLTTGLGSSGDATGDQFINIENLRGSFFDDDLTGDAGNNRLWGANGNDILFGAEGTDFLRGGLGNDILNGGAGFDWADYATSFVAVNVNLLANTATGGEAEGDFFIDIERLQGSRFDDSLTGDHGSNTLIGGGGDDVLIGNDGFDALVGGPGNDQLEGGAGPDRFTYQNATFGLDTILDFEDGVDQIDLRTAGLTFDSFAVAPSGFADTSLTLKSDTSNSIILFGIDDSLITAADFLS